MQRLGMKNPSMVERKSGYTKEIETHTYAATFFTPKTQEGGGEKKVLEIHLYDEATIYQHSPHWGNREKARTCQVHEGPSDEEEYGEPRALLRALALQFYYNKILSIESVNFHHTFSIGDVNFVKELCDLKANINLMSLQCSRNWAWEPLH